MRIARLPEDTPVRRSIYGARVHTHTHARTHTQTHARTHARTHAHKHQHTHARAHTHAQTRTDTHARIHTRTHRDTCAATHRHARPPARAKVFKTSHVDVAATYANLGSVHRLLGEYDTALAYHHKARSHLGSSVPT